MNDLEEGENSTNKKHINQKNDIANLKTVALEKEYCCFEIESRDIGPKQYQKKK